jgi:hypothetical protein
MFNGVDGIDFSAISELFGDNTQQVSPPAVDGTTHGTDDGSSNEETNGQIENTKAFAKRLNEKTEKARLEEREKIAKDFGYESYDSMVKEREKKLLEDKGLTPEEVSPIVEELVSKRLNDDPRMQELNELRRQRTEEFAKEELAKLNKLTDGAITSMNQIPKDVIDEWTKTGSLTGAYMKLHGEELLIKVKSEQSNGSTGHLKTPGAGSNIETGKRLLTKEELKVCKAFNPKMTDEELSKIMVDK